MEAKLGPTPLILIKIAAAVIIGPFTYSIYALPVTIIAMVSLIFLFFISLYQRNYFSFLMQLFICNHFTYGYEIGGTFNLAASIALIAYLFLYGRSFFSETSFTKTTVFFIVIFCIIQVLSLANSSTPLSLLLSSAITLFNFFFLFYYSSKITLNQNHYIAIIEIIGVFFIYMFANALNQRYNFFFSPYEFFPNLGEDTVWELDIPRSAGTLGNFEFYAEYSISVIALCLPGILSGTFKKISNRFYIFTILVSSLGLFAIVLSGTRSSILLLPVLIVLAIVFLGKRIKIINIAGGIFGLFLLFIINESYKFFDFEVFSKRSEQVNMNSLSVKSIVSGKDMNRGDIFEYGFKKIERSGGFFGDGYFTKRTEYVVAHFDSPRTDDIPDYHNLYMSSVVLWGYFGAFVLLFLFFSTMIRGFSLYNKLRAYNHYLTDLLLGFNLLFLFLMINQFKIQFIRDANYFMLILLILVFYNSLIYLLSNTKIIYHTDSTDKL
ncbi:hypothetical protein DU508_22685 [Pedobacter chinensis]|uniref:O-antigen ligase-related domain-containing protein n=1 Tax=Pedobacter chinensis TaxID=2282421 RepID=A0A369PTK5_9SPHI|nr:O-antigen ligase family protein [Pedobacter chinensis]RDC54297.1 hypothetical protein DU508_22685 [Pedobacter chinensis]